MQETSRYTFHKAACILKPCSWLTQDSWKMAILWIHRETTLSRDKHT